MAKTRPMPSRRITDLATRPHAAQVVRAVPAPSPSPTPAAPVAAVSPPRPSAPRPAVALHSRVKPAHVLDLRDTPPPAPAPTPLVQTTRSAPGIPGRTQQTPAAPPHTTAHERHAAHFADRFSRAKEVDRSPHVSRFSSAGYNPAAPAAPATPIAAPHVPSQTPAPTHAAQPLPPAPTRRVIPASGITRSTVVNRPTPATAALPPHVITQHQAMADLAARHATIPSAPLPTHPVTPKPKTITQYRPHLSLTPQTGRVAAISAAVIIMVGYVWIQNYPKLSLQAASNRAGITASLPGYVPSSYNLAHTDTAPGLVTLNFTSPNIADPLKIAQAKTTWDSSSLLDNYVIHHTDDYSTVQGQGLTIYFYGQNQASWVNHGIWYSIEGAARLSREQILKIAFSL